MSPTRPKLVAFLVACLVACLVAFFAWPAVALAATSADGRWHPGIGDPDATGWITVMAYIATAVLAAINARAAQRSGVKPGFWIGLAVLLTLLGINKQLDLQTWFTEVGRDLAFAGGWYEDRRIVQGVFIAVLCMLAALTAGALRHRLARDWHDYRLAFAGVLLLMLFIIVRAATFHHIDRLVRMDVAGLRINVWLEVGAIAVVAAACLQWRRMHRQRVRAFFLRSLRVRRTVR